MRRLAATLLLFSKATNIPRATPIRGQIPALPPQSLLLTSAVHDHVNVFPTHADYLAPFRQLIANLPSDGLIVVCADEPHAMALARAAPCRLVTYALSDKNAGYRAENIVYGEESTFESSDPASAKR